MGEFVDADDAGFDHARDDLFEDFWVRVLPVHVAIEQSPFRFPAVAFKKFDNLETCVRVLGKADFVIDLRHVFFELGDEKR